MCVACYSSEHLYNPNNAQPSETIILPESCIGLATDAKEALDYEAESVLHTLLDYKTIVLENVMRRECACGSFLLGR